MRSFAKLVLLVAVSTGAVWASEIPGRIAYVGLDHQVYVADPNGGEPKALTRGSAGRMTRLDPRIRPVADDSQPTEVEQRYSWPTWTFDGTAILAMGATIGAGGVQSTGVYKLDPRRPGVSTPVYETPAGQRAPIYIYASPAGKEAGIIVADPRGLGLGVVDLAGGPLRPLGVGFPFYFSWRRDGAVIVSHTGGAASEGHPAEVNWIEVQSARAGKKPDVKRLSDAPVSFRAPSWSPDGTQVAYAVRRETGRGARLVVRSGDGETRELASLASHLVFTWAPDSRALAVAEATTPDSLLFGGVTLVQVADGRRETLYAGPVSAFFWSPDARRVLIAAPEFDSGEFRWLIVGRADHQVREVGRFFPTPEFQFMAPHFDQFAMSHCFWSPDSRHFVFSGYPTTAHDESRPVPATVWIIDVDTAKVKRVAEGRAAFWSPK